MNFQEVAGHTKLIFLSRALATRYIVFHLGLAQPLSMRAIVDCAVPLFLANSDCVSPYSLRAVINISAKYWPSGSGAVLFVSIDVIIAHTL